MVVVKHKPKVWILDSNVLVYWIMGKYILKWLIVEYFKLSEDLVNTYLKRYEDSITFVDEALKQKKKDHRFYVVDLSLNEIFSGVKDEVKSIILFKNGYPISRWTDRRLAGQIQLEEEQIVKIRDFIYESWDVLMEKFMILFIPYYRKKYFEVYSSLTLLNIAMRTQDAILLTTAILEKANYFITKDDSSIGKYKEMIKNQYGLEIVRPKQGLNILKRKIK